MDIHRVFINSDALNISAMVHQNNYVAINMDYPVGEYFYVVQFTPIPYNLQDSIELNDDTITEVTSVCDENIYESCTGNFTCRTLSTMQSATRFIPQCWGQKPVKPLGP